LASFEITGRTDTEVGYVGLILDAYVLAPLAFQMILARVCQDTVKPGAEALGIAASREIRVRLHKGRLNQVGRHIVLAGHPQGMPEEHVLVPPDEQAESVAVPSGHPCHDFVVGQLVWRLTH
jgi:hypothetical protein